MGCVGSNSDPPRQGCRFVPLQIFENYAPHSTYYGYKLVSSRVWRKMALPNLCLSKNRRPEDMVVQFFTMYPITTARGVQWEDSLSKIAKHYLRTWFPVDLLTVIPFDAGLRWRGSGDVFCVLIFAHIIILNHADGFCQASQCIHTISHNRNIWSYIVIYIIWYVL